MKSLQELPRIVTEYDSKKNDFFLGERSATKYKKVVKLLASEDEVSDRRIANIISLKPDGTAYRMFKSRLKKKLLEWLPFLEVDHAICEETKVIRLCILNQYKIKLFSILHASEAALELSRKTLSLSAKYELHEVSIFCLKYQRSYYFQAGETSKYIETDKNIVEYKRRLFFEDRAQSIIERVYILNGDARSPIKKVNLYLSKLQGWNQEFKSSKIEICILKVAAFMHYSDGKINEAASKWENIISVITRTHGNHYLLADAHLNYVSCSLMSGHLETATNHLHICSKLDLSPNESNRRDRLFIKAFIYGGNYREAQSMGKALSYKSGEREAYHLILSLLIAYEAHKLGTTTNEAIYKALYQQLKKTVLINPLIKKDKQGLNVTVICLQVILLAAIGEFSKISEIIGGIKRYASRYLGDHKRSKAYLAYVVEMERNSFEISDIYTLANKNCILNILTEGYYEESEILPYKKAMEMFAFFCRQGA